MSKSINTKYRSHERELMDDFDMKGDLLRDTLDKLGKINRWLGGNKVTMDGIKRLLRGQSKSKRYRIVDLGCGHGDMLRQVALYGRHQGYDFELIGIDANRDAIQYAEELSAAFPELSFRHMDIFSEQFGEMRHDIVLSTLFIHHFSDKEISSLLLLLSKSAGLGIVVNDLHRTRLAYALFKILGLFIPNEMIVQDGLTSILKAFKRKELEELSNQLQLNSEIHWKWAFRYQWLIKT